MPSSFSSIRFVRIHEVHQYSSMGTTAAWKKLCFTLSDMFDSHMTDDISIAVHAFASRLLMWFSVDETLLPRLMNLSIISWDSPFSVEMLPFWLNHMCDTHSKTITDADNADDIAILANTPNQAETLLHSLERATADIGLHVNAHKTEYMCFNQAGDIFILEGTSLKLVDKFTYLGSRVSSTEKDIDTRLTKEWTAVDRLSIIWKSDLTDKMKRSFFQAAVVSILLYGCTTLTPTKRLEKKLDGNYTRMLLATLNKSWRQHPTRHQLYDHLPPITKTIQVRRTRHAGQCWRSRD